MNGYPMRIAIWPYQLVRFFVATGRMGLVDWRCRFARNGPRCVGDGRDWRRHSGEAAMNRNNIRFSLVIEVIDLLRQVRSGLNSESSRNLELSIDEAIEKLEGHLRECRNDSDHVVAVLEILGRGLAALPAIERLIEMIMRR